MYKIRSPFLIMVVVLNINPIILDLDMDSFRRVRAAAKEDFESLGEHLDRENAQKVTTDLAKMGFSQNVIREAIRKIIEFIELDSVPDGWWPGLVEVNLAALLAFPRIIALDAKKASHLLIKPDFAEKRAIFNNKSLIGLIAYFERAPEEDLKKIFNELNVAHFELGRMYILRWTAKILPRTPLEWRERQKEFGSNFNWDELLLEPPEIEAELVEIIGREEIFPQLSKEDPTLEYYPLNTFVPLYLLKSRWILGFLNASFMNHGGKTIEYKKYIQAYPSPGNMHYGNYYKYLWIDYIRNSIISWEEQEVPEAMIEHLVLRTSQEKARALENLLREDFENLVFLRHMVWDGREIKYENKGLERMLKSGIYVGMPNFRKEIISPLMKKIEKEVKNIKREIVEKNRVTDWHKYSLWAIKTYIEKEILRPKNKDWQELQEPEVPVGLLVEPSRLRLSLFADINSLKAIFWVDLDLLERIFVYPITTEDWVTRLLWTGSMEWGKTSKGVRKDWVRMLAAQLDMSIDELLNHPKDSEIYRTRIDFKSDPLSIFSETFRKLVPLIPDIDPTEDWSLRALLDEVYEGDPNKLKEDLFREDY